MRIETKKRLLAVLESDLAKAKQKLDNPKHRAELDQVNKEMSEMGNKLQTTTGSAYYKLALRFEELQEKSDKLFKDAKKYSDSIPKLMNEQWALEEEIQELKMMLSYARPDLATKF